MQAKVGVYSNADTSLVKVLNMSKIGTVDTGTCTSITVDPLKNEYITSMTLRWGVEHITRISISASNGQILSRGFTTTNYNEKVVNFSSSTQLVGFYGSHDLKIIRSVGTVRLDKEGFCCDPFVSNCAKQTSTTQPASTTTTTQPTSATTTTQPTSATTTTQPTSTASTPEVLPESPSSGPQTMPSDKEDDSSDSTSSDTTGNKVESI